MLHHDAIPVTPDMAVRLAVIQRSSVTHGPVGCVWCRSSIPSATSRGLHNRVACTDDVFKSSDYRISPFELESALIEHEAVAEAAIVPSPHPLRLAVPKAFVALAGEER